MSCNITLLLIENILMKKENSPPGIFNICTHTKKQTNQILIKNTWHCCLKSASGDEWYDLQLIHSKFPD